MRKSFTICFLLWLINFSPVNVFASNPDAVLTPAQVLFYEAQDKKREGDFLKARDLYHCIFHEYPKDTLIVQVEKEIQDVNVSIIHSSIFIPESVLYVVREGDTLGKIAKKFKTTVELIKKRNHLTKDIIYPNQKLSVWAGVFNIVISKSRNVLYLRIGQGIVKSYPVSTGKSDTITPIGEYTIVHRYPDPVWYHKGVVVPPGTPENFLGTRFLGFDKPGYGIHGTTQPELIGQSVSGGCVRMRNEDVEELYDIIPIGTKTVIVN